MVVYVRCKDFQAMLAVRAATVTFRARDRIGLVNYLVLISSLFRAPK